jgi:hypothetical protein
LTFSLSGIDDFDECEAVIIGVVSIVVLPSLFVGDIENAATTTLVRCHNKNDDADDDDDDIRTAMMATISIESMITDDDVEVVEGMSRGDVDVGNCKSPAPALYEMSLISTVKTRGKEQARILTLRDERCGEGESVCYGGGG